MLKDEEDQELDALPTEETNWQLDPEQSHLLKRFTSFLIQQPEKSLTDSDSIDLYSLFREQAELKNEIKLESRQIKKVLEDYKELMGLLKSNNELLSQQLSQANEVHKKTLELQRREYALELIGFCDYLNRSVEQIKLSSKRGWFTKRIKSAAYSKQILEGQKLLLARFISILNGLDVKAMTVVDKPFDPSIMNVGEICSKPDRPNAIVISELQAGYYIGQSILRQASVIVNKLN